MYKLHLLKKEDLHIIIKTKKSEILFKFHSKKSSMFCNDSSA